MQPGSSIRFGESTRLYVLSPEAPSEDLPEPFEKHGERPSGERLELLLAAVARWFAEHEETMKFESVPSGAGEETRLRIVLPASLIGDLDRDVIVEAAGRDRREAELNVAAQAHSRLRSLGVLTTEDGGEEGRAWEDWREQRRQLRETEADTYYDRTISVEEGNGAGDDGLVHSVETLLHRRDALRSRLDAELQELKRWEDKNNASCQASEEQDELDTFMMGVKRELVDSERVALDRAIELTRTQLQDTEAILKTVFRIG